MKPNWFVTLLIVLGVAASARAAEKRPMTVEDLWTLKRPGALSVSPDGRSVVLEVTGFDMKENNSSGDLWLLATDGSTQRQLTRHPARDGDAHWSPDGRWIAFTSKREGDDQPQVYLIAPDGGEARQLTKLSTGAASIKWFPKSRQIAFISWVWPELMSDEEQAKRLKERAEAKVKAFVIEQTTYRFWDHWLADGRVPHVFAVNIDTAETRDLFAGTPLSLVNTENSLALSSDLYDIAPDEGEIALAANLAVDPGFDPTSDVLALRLSDGTWRNLTSANSASDLNPRYSPDGRWLAYTRQAIKHFYADRLRLMLLDRASGTQRELTESWDYSVKAPQWAGDSQAIFFTAEDRAQDHLYRIDLRGGEPSVVVRGGAVQNFDLSRDGRIVVFGRSTMSEPPGVFVSSSQDGASTERRLENFNDALVARWQLGQVENVTFKGWNDEPVQMWVIFPPDFDATKKWPLLQNVHGGPHNASLDQFHFRWNNQLFASHGYVVAVVNFHGSGGFGQAFTDSITGQYGTKEFVDVERGTDHLLARGYINPERLAAAGGSYGGYMVAWMNGHTDRYKAYVCHAGVFDWVAQGASDSLRGRERALGAFPWDDPAKVLAQSAHSYAKHFKTPTLVIHGELDYRVPVAQGLEYYGTLRMLNVPSRLLYFPDENHWVLKPQNSRLWHQEFFGWIGRYAAPGGK